MATAAKKNAARKATTRKPAAKKAVAPKRTNARNVGATCSVKGCTHPAKRRGLCSGRGSNGHYRKALRAERKLDK